METERNLRGREREEGRPQIAARDTLKGEARLSSDASDRVQGPDVTQLAADYLAVRESRTGMNQIAESLLTVVENPNVSDSARAQADKNLRQVVE